ncbi:MAG: DUF2306 domain-containing protein [Bacteroidota bacterium]
MSTHLDQGAVPIYRKVVNAVGIFLLFFFSYQMLMIIWPYRYLGWDIDFLRTKQDVIGLEHWRYAFWVHIFSSMFVLLAGATQFSSWFLRQLPRIHRWVGMLYVVLIIFVTGPAAIVMSFYSNGGMIGRVSFVILAVGWWVFTLLAYLAVRKHDYPRHARWMIRSYALTFSAITLRIYQFLFGWWFDFDHVVQYAIVAWLSWTINLVVGEWLIKRGVVERILQKR